MKVYTKTGDAGISTLLGGTKVSKDNIRLEAYGTVDELNSCTGLLRDGITEMDDVVELLITIQKQLFEIGSELAVDPENPPGFSFDTIDDKDVEMLEKAIDGMSEELPELKNFILPGGNTSSSYAQICRTVARRAERRIVALHEAAPVRSEIVTYINRLSDYFFVLARYILHQVGSPELIWTSRKK